MTLTEEEQKICDYYGQRFDDGKVGCSRCPLAIDTRYCLCKANCTEEEWAERKEKGCWNCEHQIEPLRACEWLEKGGDGVVHMTCPRWTERKDENGK